MRKRKLNRRQKEFLVGTLIGDGCLLQTTRGYCLRIHHGIKQKNYVKWKYRIMKNFVNTPPKFDGKGYYFRTVSNPVFNEYRKMFYQGKKKKLPENIGDLLTPLGLATLIMDDGSRDKGNIRISTHNFSYTDQLKLQKALKVKFNINSSIQKAKDKFWLWIKSESIPRLIKLVRPYFIPNLLYKLPSNDYLTNNYKKRGDSSK